MNLLKSFFARFFTEPALKSMFAKFGNWLHSMVDISVAYLLMLALNYVNSTDNDVILQQAGPVGFAGWVSVLVAIAGLITRFLPFILSPPKNPKGPLVLLLLLSIPVATIAAPISGLTSYPTPHFIAVDLPKNSTGVWVVIPKPTGERLNADGSFDFWGPPGTYSVMLIEVTRMGDQIRTEQIVTLGADSPAPNPGPPAPAPPNIPDGVHGFTKWAYTKIAAMPAADKAKAKDVAIFLRATANQLVPGATQITATINGKPATYESSGKGLQLAAKDYWFSLGGTWPTYAGASGDLLRNTSDFKKMDVEYRAAWLAWADGMELAADTK